LISNSTGSFATRVNTLETNYTTLNGTVSGKASTSYVDTAVTNSTASLASSLQTLTTNFNNKVIADSATYTNLVSLISNSTGSFATRINTLETNFNTLSTGTSTGATVSYVDTAVARSTASLASSLQTLTTNFNNKVIADSATYTNLVSLISNSTGSFATRVNTLETNYTTLSGTVSGKASTSYVDTAVTNSTGSFATSIQTLQTAVGTQTTSITNFSSSIDGIKARYGVTIDNNGAITGYEINSGGSSSTFIVKADNFKVYTGSGPVVPFSVSGSTVNMANAAVTGSLSIGSSPARSNTTMTGSGAVIDNNGTFAFGNSSKSVVWDGTTLTVNGDVVATGNLQANAVTGFGLYNDTSNKVSSAAIGTGYNYFTIATLYFQSYGNPVIVDCQVVGKIDQLYGTSGSETFEIALFVDGSIVSCTSGRKDIAGDAAVLPDGSNLSYYQDIAIPLFSFTPNTNIHTYELKMIYSKAGGSGYYSVAAKNVSIRALELKR